MNYPRHRRRLAVRRARRAARRGDRELSRRHYREARVWLELERLERLGAASETTRVVVERN